MADKNLIFNALAYKDDYSSRPGLDEDFKSGIPGAGVQMYLKNSFVSLKSAKLHNPNDEVALFTNFILPEAWKIQFQSNDISIIYCDYNKFLMPKETPFSLAFYKLCALDFAVNHLDYIQYCILDCDTYVNGDFENIWEDSRDTLLCKNTLNPSNHPWRKEISEIYYILYRTKKPITHLSGSVFAGSKDVLKRYLSNCYECYSLFIDEYKKNDLYIPISGDELIWSMGYENCIYKMNSIEPYFLNVNHGWSRKGFYGASHMRYDGQNICIWHLISEKRYSMIWLYNYYTRHHAFPDIKTIATACRIRNIHVSLTLLSLRTLLLDKNIISRNSKKRFKLV